MKAERSTPAVYRICVSIEVVVVFPCVPETQMARSYQLVTMPSSSLRSRTGTPLSFAAISSGLSAIMAAVCTIKSAPTMFSAFCPSVTGMPMSRTAWRVSVSLLSEPVRKYPLACRICASGYIPDPPIPIKWICFLPFKILMFKKTTFFFLISLIFFVYTGDYAENRGEKTKNRKF